MRASYRASLIAFAALLAGCSGNDFDKPSEVKGVRVLAVRPSGAPLADGSVPASGFPGETMTLDMLYMDGRNPVDPSTAPPTNPPGLTLAWLGGCHNPASRLYYGCGPFLEATADRLASGVAPEDLPPGSFGIGTPFVLPIPDDILSNAVLEPTDPIHFGVSYVFFAVCAGTLQPRPGRADGLPLDCLDDAGNSLGPHDFVVGFTTVYTYEQGPNLNPVLDNLFFDGNPVSGPGCGEPGSCVPRVPACGEGDDCPEHRIAPEVSDASFEHMPDGTNEILWASYYATTGEVTKESQLVNDRNAGRVEDFTSGWRAPATPGPVRLWVTLNDERAGVTWVSFDVIVE